MRFLIAGFGSIGRRHFRNLLALGQTDIIFLRSNKSTLETDELDGFIVETDLEKALLHKPGAVILANPTSLHLDVAIPAAKAGCHLFFEKPISESMERIPDLRDALEIGGGKAVTGFQFRFHPGIQRIKKMLSEKTIGEVVSARAHWGDFLPGWHPWEDYRKSYSARKDLGGGVVLTLCHPLDYLNYLLGAPGSIFSFQRKVDSLEIETEAVAEIGIQYKKGTIASVQVNYIQRPGKHTLELVGDLGTIRWDNADGIVQLYLADEERWQTFLPPKGFERNDLFLAEMKNFLAVIQDNATMECSLDDGITAQLMVEAVHRSYEEQRIIHLD